MATFQLEKAGIALRFGDADTAAPEGSYSGDGPPRIVVAVRPADPRLRVYVHVQVGDNRSRTFGLRAERRVRGEQFFEGTFQGLRTGDHLSYSVSVELARPDGTVTVDSSESPLGVRSLEISGGPLRGRGIPGPSGAARSSFHSASSSSETPDPRATETRTNIDSQSLAGEDKATLSGEIRLGNGLPAVGLRFQLLREVFGKTPEVIADVTTDESGRYTLPEVGLHEDDSLLAKVAGHGPAEPGLMTPLSARQDATSLNFLAPVGTVPTQSEYARLRAALRPVAGDLDLADAVEDETRSDITLAFRLTGWDARLIAVSSLAARLGRPPGNHDGGLGIGPEVAYAMLRVGLPSERDLLARVPRETVERALTKAAESGIVDLGAPEIAAAGERFAEFSVEHRLGSRPGGGLSSMKELLDASGLADDGAGSPLKKFQNVLLNTADGHVWERARGEGLDDDQITMLQAQAKLAFLTTNNVPLMRHVQEQTGDGGVVATIRDKAWDLTETWEAAIGQVGGEVAVPASYRSADGVATYAAELARRVRVAYPTEVTAALVARGDLELPEVAAEPLAQTLDAAAAEGFRLGSQSPATFLDEHAAVVQGLDDDTRGRVTTALETLHRVHQITPSNEAMKVMLDKGLLSAYDVVATSERDFVARYGPLFPTRKQARLVYRKSEQVSAVLYNFHAMTSLAVSPPVLFAVQGDTESRQASVERIQASMSSPTMESLFGSMDYCDCDHCRSVLSPAAYLVELLKFLDPEASAWKGFLDAWKQRHQSTDYAFGTPLQELRIRRPDLEHLELTCENTNIVLPTIDLVTEILEFILAPAGFSASTVHDSGMLGSADVLSEPEFMETTVYDTLLRTAKHPSALPFDLWHETTREFADRLETPLTEVMDVFEGDADALAAERLGFTAVEYAVVTADDPTIDWWTRFGFAPEAAEEANALGVLGMARAACRALGIGYQQLVELLGTRWVNPGLAGLEVLGTAGVSVADAVVWRAHQDLIGANKPADPAEQLRWTTVQSAQRRLEAVTDAFGLTDGQQADAWLRSQGDELFDSVVVLADPDASCSLDKAFLAEAGTQQAVAVDALAQLMLRLDLFLRLQRRLRWNTEQLDAVLAAYLPSDAAFGGSVRLAIRRIGRQQELAALLDHDGPPAVLASLWAPMDASLYDALFLAGPARDRDPVFLAPLGNRLTALPAGVTVGDHVPGLQSALGLTAGDITAVLAAEGHDLTTDLSRDIVEVLHRHAALADALDMEIGDLLVLRRLTGHPGLDGGLDAPVVDLARLCLTVDRSAVSVAELDLLAASRFDPEGRLAPDLDAVKVALGTIAQAIAGMPVATQDEQRAATVTMAKAVAAAFGRPAGMLREILAFGTLLFDAYLQVNESADHAGAIEAHQRVGRVLLLVDRVGLELGEVLEFGLLELPVTSVDGAAPGADQLRRLLEYIALREAAAGGSSELLTVLTTARADGDAQQRLTAACSILARLARREPDDVVKIAEALGTNADALGTVEGATRLWRALELVGRSGVPATTLSGWTAIADGATSDQDRHRIAREARDALRGRSTVAVWQRVATPSNDRLRQRRRDALVAAALPRMGLDTIEELYQYLLLDPGSEPVLRTSRIRQAISSVQTFIQRCLLGEEERVHPSTLNSDQWAWMRRYRVWEANRKIFLFPENWLEPEFRDDKSHLFQELESTLVQNDVSADVVEDAFLVYLRKLDEIARLEMCGMYWDQDPLDPGNNTLHVIGRTYGLPRQYFYRRQQLGAWTPWEPMGVEIEGDHIVPVVWRDRLHVFWVTFLEQPDSADAEAAGGPQFIRDSLSGVTHVMGSVGVLGSGGSGGGGVSLDDDAPPPPKALAEATLDEVKTSTQGSGVRRHIDVALHWTEYVAGTWSAPTSSGFEGGLGFTSRSTFDPGAVFVHSSVVYDAQGQEAGVQVHLTGATIRTFLLRGRNSPAESGHNVPRPPVPFSGTARVNHYDTSGSFSVVFNQRLTATDDVAPVASPLTLTVLGATGRFSVLPTSNAVTLGGSEIGSLVTPFFLADAQRTFFVEPSVVETTTETFESYLVSDPGPYFVFPADLLDDITVQPYVPDLAPPDLGHLAPKDNPWPDVFRGLPVDVLTGPSTGLVFGDRVLGPRGPVNVTTLNADRTITTGHDAVRPGSLLASGGAVQVADHDGVLDAGPMDGLTPDMVAVIRPDALAHAGLTADVGELNVIGGIGLAAHLGGGLRRRTEPVG